MELAQRDREHAFDMEIGRLHSRMTEISEDMNNRLAQRDMKIREEMQARYVQLEMVRDPCIRNDALSAHSCFLYYYILYIFVLLENIGRQTATRIHDQNLNTRYYTMHRVEGSQED